MTGDEEEPFLLIFGETAVASTMKMPQKNN